MEVVYQNSLAENIASETPTVHIRVSCNPYVKVVKHLDKLPRDPSRGECQRHHGLEPSFWAHLENHFGASKWHDSGLPDALDRHMLTKT
ncbi:unnamed protein product [Dovyalis caffra]|uniref:Uncharacterized protein n=1 Tax=Dovyalis caffra TaxID=77055 RepID=A0AAV1RZF5_9ROSI|nr:unnamed protein product [Dovyalis caffra]